MATFAEMKTRISDDINRSDLDTQIGVAINRAISKYKSEPFWFTEAIQSFTLAANTKSYDSNNSLYPSTVGRIQSLTVNINSSNYPLTPVTLQQYQEMNISDDTGDPEYFTQFSNKLYLYPVPDASVTATVYYTKTFAALSASADTNEFLSYAEDLIESRASWWVNSRIIKDETAAAMDKAAEIEALKTLRGDTTAQASMRIEPTCF